MFTPRAVLQRQRRPENAQASDLPPKKRRRLSQELEVDTTNTTPATAPTSDSITSLSRLTDTNSPLGKVSQKKSEKVTNEEEIEKGEDNGQTTLNKIEAELQNKETVHLQQLIHGLELIFSDWSHADPSSRQWLENRERDIDHDGGGYIHLSPLTSHPIFSRTKPPVTQSRLQKALQQIPGSQILELSKEGHHVRRKSPPDPPSQKQTQIQPGQQVTSTPTSTKKTNEANVWDDQTVYIVSLDTPEPRHVMQSLIPAPQKEPHIHHLTLNPPQLLHHLQSHSRLPSSLYPVQAVRSSQATFAFLVFSAPVDEALVAESRHWPSDWIILTK
ncbi:MAG: hypothetical protein M1819_004143 [Sarea resinae]|nr:MAG: hypothetical protein M1819_004143 [Sarea resinae]